MGRYTNLITHCLETPPWFNVSIYTLDEWHKGPCDVRDTKGNLLHVVYLGKKYKTRDLLPDDYVNGTSIKKLHGRGWDRYGYTDILLQNGDILNITLNNNDDIIERHEVTWGATGFNVCGKHIALAGGLDNNRKPQYGFDKLYSSAQKEALKSYYFNECEDHPQIKISGHNQHSTKTCPNFDVPQFCREILIPEKFIYHEI